MYKLEKPNELTGLNIIVETAYVFLDEKVMKKGGLNAKKEIYNIVKPLLPENACFGYGKLKKTSRGMEAIVKMPLIKFKSTIYWVALLDPIRNAIYIINYQYEGIRQITGEVFHSKTNKNGKEYFYIEAKYILTKDGDLFNDEFHQSKVYEYLDKVLLY